ncbi:MAG: hypothetical protein A2033_15630 [Bacteroidetes bacterium GWA2_31_9]|nr:MAG: hypothetical protein A2033_15630 [Bacteroidetes bacterium GWA2_31_9]
MRYIIIILISVFFQFVASSQTSENYNGETINLTDAEGLKQGKWLKFNTDKTVVIEEGKYVNNKKEELWKQYYNSGKIKTELTYKNNKADGYAKFYYENGNVSEEGLWQSNKWIGAYKMYFENGNLSYEWNYTEQGKRTGVQKYYHPNGKIMIEGDWQEGKENGIIKEYDDSGNLVAEKNFNGGKFDVATSKEYTTTSTNNNTTNNTTQAEIKKDTVKTNTNVTTTTKALELFTGTGYNKLYTKDGKIEQEGDFVNGILMKGKKFYYDATGKLSKTAIIKDGKVLNVIVEEHK